MGSRGFEGARHKTVLDATCGPKGCRDPSWSLFGRFGVFSDAFLDPTWSMLGLFGKQNLRFGCFRKNNWRRFVIPWPGGMRGASE